MKSWKTTLFAILAALANVPVVINALWDYAADKPVNWKFVCVSVAITFLAWASHQSKDKDDISTLPEVLAATQKARQEEVAAAIDSGKPLTPPSKLPVKSDSGSQ